MALAGPSPEPSFSGDYSFAVVYEGPPLPYDVPRALPIDVDLIPLAAPLDSPAAIPDPLSLPVVHPITSPAPSPSKRHVIFPTLPEESPKSPTSVIENYAAMDASGEVASCPDFSAELSASSVAFPDEFKLNAVSTDVSGEVASCPDLSAELSVSLVPFSDEFKPDRLSTEVSGEVASCPDLSADLVAFSAKFKPNRVSEFRSDDDADDYEDDDEVVAMEAKKALLVKFGDNGESSGSATNGAVAFSDEFKASESTTRSESGFHSDEDFVDGDDDEVAAMQAKKALLVTFQDNGESSGSAKNGLMGETQPMWSEEFETRVKKGACFNCLRGNRFMEKEACLVCDAKYCSRCVLSAMGSMVEGRKCFSCIGSPIMESKRERLGKSSRMLKRLLSAQEIQLAMKAEKECEANQLRPEHICVNGVKLSQEELILLQTCACPPPKLKPGYYWYDKVSGFWGKVGHKPEKIITSNLNIGGTLPQDASNGNTGILINGREITKVELKMLKWAGIQCAGSPHFWVNAEGVIQEEGQKKIMGHIWEKPMMKLLCPVLSLPIPSKDGNFGAEEVASLTNTTFPDYLDHKVPQKLLLVGSYGSGTSTIYKQAKFLYKSVPFSDNERQDIKFMIQSSIYKYLIILLEGRELFEEESLIEQRNEVHSSDECTDVTEFSIGPRLKGFSDWLLTIVSSGNLEAIFPASSREYATLVEELWNDPAIQATHGRLSELRLLPSAASYFLERVVDISRVEYEPSDKDILYADGIASCTGLTFTDLIIPHLNLVRRDIDGADQQDTLQRFQLIRVDTKGLGDTYKCLNMFEDVRLVIFCVALSDYDVYFEDANGVVINKMMESKILFEFIASHPAAHDKEFLLVLSKFDQLEQKIDSNPLSLCEWFMDFNPVISKNRPKKIDGHSATVAEQASYYIAVKFKRLFTSITERKLYVKVINGLQAESVDSAIRYAVEVLKWDEEKLFEFAPGESFYSEPSSFLN